MSTKYPYFKQQEKHSEKTKYIVIAAIAVAVMGFGFLLFKQDQTNQRFVVKSDPALPPVGTALTPQQGLHINQGASHDAYNSNPPTSGPHYLNPPDFGVYNTPQQDEGVVHDLEHGGIWISYKDIDPDTLSKLQQIAKNNPKGVILTPRPANDAKIVLASWGRMEKLESFDESKIFEFIKANKNKSPEKMAL